MRLILYLRGVNESHLIYYSPVYTTEDFWHGSGEIGTGSKDKGSARIKFAV